MNPADNYPPGVTGREFAIAGPDHEWDEMMVCVSCGQAELHLCQSYGLSVVGMCYECEGETEWETDDFDLEDYDRPEPDCWD